MSAGEQLTLGKLVNLVHILNVEEMNVLMDSMCSVRKGNDFHGNNNMMSYDINHDALYT